MYWLFLLILLTTKTMAIPYIDEQIKNLTTYKESIQEKEEFLKNLENFKCKGLALELGESYPYLPEIRQFFLIKGLLLSEKTTDDLVFDESLQQTVKLFQKRNFLPSTGIFNEKTCKKLIKPLKKEITSIEKNIDRLQKLKEKIKHYKKVIVINIPQYEMTCIQDDFVDHTIKVIVGKSSRETPLMEDSISSILINPTWTIPEMILVKDKIKVFSKNPNYIKNHNYSVMDAFGNELDPHTINWENVKNNPTFYKFRQHPGKHNALGLIKFVMNNKDNIHMHGTNQQSLFEKEDRSLSSGCIRVEDPISFASWLLSEQSSKFCKYPQNPTDCLQKTIKNKIKKQHSQSLLLTHAIPVLFSYVTIWADTNGNIYANDPYHKDL